MQNSIDLNLTTEGMSIPSTTMNHDHLFKAIEMLYRELYFTLPDHMTQIIYEKLSDDLELVTRQQYDVPDEDYDLPF